MTPARPFPTAARKAALGTCTRRPAGCGGERSIFDGESAMSNERNAPQGPQSVFVRETDKTHTPAPSRQAPPSVASGAGNLAYLIQAARADVDARRSDAAAVDRLARWLDAGRRVIASSIPDGMEAHHAE